MLDPPPELPTEGGRKWSQMLMVLPMLAGAGAMALLFTGGRGGPLGYVAGGLFGVSALGMVADGLHQRWRRRARRRWPRPAPVLPAPPLPAAALGAADGRAAAARRCSTGTPTPTSCGRPRPAIGCGSAGPTHADFGVVRIGLGPQALATPVVPPQTGPLDELEPLSAAALRRFVLT